MIVNNIFIIMTIGILVRKKDSNVESGMYRVSSTL